MNDTPEKEPQAPEPQIQDTETKSGGICWGAIKFKSGQFLDGKALPDHPIEVTVKSSSEQKMAQGGMKWVVFFEELGTVGMILGAKCNRQAISARLGDSRKDWVGKKLTIYFDANVKFGPKTVGGIRIK